GRQAVLYFYPKDNTPGCTTQGQGFRDLHEQFLAANTLVLGVSRDSLR
ncbi:MAG TPA: peroxiredoxin, partial [Pseudomonas sp.]|nr:peroxiredoxin [Pseudomonas sp.]